MTRLPLSFGRLCALPLALFAAFANAATPTHCRGDEDTYFSCKLANSQKVASVCGGADARLKDGAWLQYRFGVPGRVEFAYPAAQEGSLQRFEVHVFSKYDYQSVLFINEKVLYEIEISEKLQGKALVYPAVINVEVQKKRTQLRCEKPVPEAMWNDMVNLSQQTHQTTGEGKDGFLWQYYNVIAKRP